MVGVVFGPDIESVVAVCPSGYVECVVDDCGWGTIANQPDFNASMEGITEFFSNISTFKKDFEAPTLEDFHFLFTGERETRYRIYKTTLSLNPQILQVVRQTHTRYLLPEAYDRSIHPIFDDYEVRGFFGKVVFSDGAVLRERGEIDLYYAGSDEVICLAQISLNELLLLLLEH